MRLSIRTKILGGYTFVIILFFAIIFNITLTQQSIRKKLKVINEDYLPKLYMVNSLTNYSHLEDSFDARKLIDNKKNKILLQSIGTYHPSLFENKLKEITLSTERSQEKTKNSSPNKLLDLIVKSLDDVKLKHDQYRKLIASMLFLLKQDKRDAILKLNDKLLRSKRELKSEISFLRKRLDNNIRQGLFQVSKMEKNASIITAILSLLAILMAGAITLYALHTLDPIRKLIASVKKISQGDYDHKVNIRTQGEMKTLAEEFNNMSKSIQERNKALKEQQKKLLQSERMAVVGRMASHITHEVKNPLNSMSLNTELLEDEIKDSKTKDSEEAFNLIKSIRKEIDRLSLITDEYLNWARIPKGESTECNISLLLKETVDFLKPELKEKNITLNENYGGTPLIFIDTAQIKKAFVNILKNAIEAVSRDQSIFIETKTENNLILVKIKDSGKGIKPEVLENIFDPFFSTKEKGTGLGLPLTQKVINEQGGEIICESTVNQGTTFTISLPLKTGEKHLNASL